LAFLANAPDGGTLRAMETDALLESHSAMGESELMSDHHVVVRLASGSNSCVRCPFRLRVHSLAIPGITIEPYVIEHGRPFTGIKRPKGYG
jgi:hypothetical protein